MNAKTNKAKSHHVLQTWRSPRSSRALLVLLLAGLALLPTSSLAQEEIPTQTQAERATVSILQAYDVEGTQALSCVGSGTLISPTGLILTNAHLALSLGPCRADKIIVALPVRPGEPPVPTYLAEVVQTDIIHNLAVLQVTAGLDGSLIEIETLNLPFVELGAAPSFSPGSPLTFVGHPDIGAEPVTSVEGTLTGVTAESNGGKLAWLRTETVIGGGMSGGGAYDSTGQLVGVLVSSPFSSSLEPGSTCRALQDTNRDRSIDERDACVPIGSEVTAIRPNTFAETLVTAARAGLRVERQSGPLGGPPGDEPIITRMFFSQQVSDGDIPTRVVDRLPAGTRSLFLLFNYENMAPGIPYEIRATADGREIPGFGLGTQIWGGGSRGLWYIGTENVNWPNGNYEFTVFLNGRAAQTASIQIGGPVDDNPRGSFSNLTFGIFDEAGALVTQGTLLPAEVTTVTGQFSYEEVRESIDWTELWFFGEEEVFRNTLFWADGSDGQKTVNAINVEGLPPGHYQLDLLLGQELAATANLTLAGTADRNARPLIFGEITTSSDISRSGEPTGIVGSAMPLDTASIYAFMSWDNLPNGVVWTQHWTRDGMPIASATERWDSGLVGENFWVKLSSADGLSEGTYRIEMFIEDRLMSAASVTIGTGAGVLSGEGVTSDAVEITGTVVDALTGEGIPSVGIMVLKTEFDFVDFLWDESQLQSQGISDREGRFALEDPLPRGILYTFLARAEGYLPVTEDGFFVPDEQESPMEIRIEMVRP
jgi:S1-C subfamily serine protease